MKIYTINELAELFQVSRSRINQMIKAKRNPLVPCRTKPFLFEETTVRAYAQAKAMTYKKYDGVLDKMA